MEHVNAENMAYLFRVGRHAAVELNRFIDEQSEITRDVKLQVGARAKCEYGEYPICTNTNKEPQLVVITADRHGFHLTEVPLSWVRRGKPRIASLNPYQVYVHRALCVQQNDKAYVGMTKQHWSVRFDQHVASARSGSQYLWHAAIREELKAERPMFYHRLQGVGLDYEQACSLEEKLVAALTLRPNGYNMIPGGLAGVRYLHMLGALNKDRFKEAVEDRAQIMSQFIRDNDSIRSLWADPSWAEKVICGHSNRLTVEQVRAIRELAKRGHQAEAILEMVGARNIPQVKRLMSEKTYARVA